MPSLNFAFLGRFIGHIPKGPLDARRHREIGALGEAAMTLSRWQDSERSAHHFAGGKTEGSLGERVHDGNAEPFEMRRVPRGERHAATERRGSDQDVFEGDGTLARFGS